MDDTELDARIYQAFADRVYLPPLVPALPATAPFLPHSTCTANAFLHPRFYELCELIQVAPCWHRKLWEWVYIAHHVTEHLRPGMRGLGFGVGTEPLPAMFASLGAQILATDAPDDHGQWSQGAQWSASAEHLRKPGILPDALFDQRVSHRPCDMAAIDEDLTDFDFNWSSCALEHLGTLDAGLDFIRNSLRTLRPGGLAVHTTELNLSSETETVEEGDTVLYRRSDLEGLVERLRRDGHTVQPFVVGPVAHFLDTHVDVPPFTAYPHLKLRLASYVTTSAGIVVQAR